MIYGRIVKISDREIFLHRELLSPLRLFPGAKASLFFNPVRDSAEYQGLSTLSGGDFGITPHPHHSWPCLVRIDVHLRNRPGSLSDLTWFLADSLKVSVLSAHVVRFGHRYARWDLVADVRQMTLRFSREPFGNRWKRARYLKVAAKMIQRRIEKDSKLHGYISDAPEWETRLSVEPMRLLHHHSPDIDNGTAPSFLKIHGEISPYDSLRITERDPYFQALEQCGVLQHTEPLGSSLWAVASYDSNSAVIRCAPIDPAKEANLRWICVAYAFRGTHDTTSAGLLAALVGALVDREATGEMPDSEPRFNLWMCTNYTEETSDLRERGHLEFLTEYVGMEPAADDLWPRLCAKLDRAIRQPDWQERFGNLKKVLIQGEVEHLTLGEHYARRHTHIPPEIRKQVEIQLARAEEEAISVDPATRQEIADLRVQVEGILREHRRDSPGHQVNAETLLERTRRIMKNLGTTGAYNETWGGLKLAIEELIRWL